jgi:hypothetical protein
LSQFIEQNLGQIPPREAELLFLSGDRGCPHDFAEHSATNIPSAMGLARLSEVFLISSTFLPINALA